MESLISPPPGGTIALLRSLVPSLVPSERRVAQACIDDPALVATMSVAQLARAVEVSPATVVRACQRMGFEGFQRLRELLIRDQGAQLGAGSQPPGGPEAAGAAHPVTVMFEKAVDGIRGALGALDMGAFDEAARAIRDSNRLLIVGNGASLAAAQSVALHFLTSGKVCENPADIVSQNISARLLQSGDVCLAVSDSGMNSFTLHSARLAASQGATVVGITSYGKSDLASISTHTLVAGAEFHAWNDATVTGNIVQMLLLSALHAAALESEPSAIAARAQVYDEVLEIIKPGE